MTKAKLKLQIKILNSIIREYKQITQKQKCYLESYKFECDSLRAVIVEKDAVIRIQKLELLFRTPNPLLEWDFVKWLSKTVNKLKK